MVANDNRRPAGQLVDGVLTLRLEVRLAEWFPQAADGPSVTLPVFAEQGKAAQVPGPLIRVPAGTLMDITVTNQLADTGVTLFGFGPRPDGAPDSVRLAPGASRHMRYRADSAGTYLYRGRTETRPFELFATTQETQLGGAIVVDDVDAGAPDRVFVINLWDLPADSSTGVLVPERFVLAINGRSWPYTERQPMTVGDSVHWRVVNASEENHPMHMHGFYYRITSEGSFDRDTSYAPADQRLVVTQSMVKFSTMRIAFQPLEPGNWLFHCHLIYHVGPDAALTWPDGMPAAHDPAMHMSGLVLGLQVAPRPGAVAPSRVGARQVRLVAREAADSASPTGWTMSYATGRDADTGPVTLPAPTLFLTRGIPTDVTVVNHLDQPTGVHWHGLELQSPADGVAGWSGVGDSVFAPIQPGDSFVAHLLQPRAGTFIYHTHLRDAVQLVSGLYGALIVLEPGAGFQPAIDHIFLLGREGEVGPLLLNGDSVPAAIEWSGGAAHRVRFINIMPYGRVEWRLLRGDTLAQWHPVARDGADLPASQRASRPARTIIDVGGTADFEVDGAQPATLRLEIGEPGGPAVVSQTIRIQPGQVPTKSP